MELEPGEMDYPTAETTEKPPTPPFWYHEKRTEVERAVRLQTACGVQENGRRHDDVRCTRGDDAAHGDGDADRAARRRHRDDEQPRPARRALRPSFVRCGCNGGSCQHNGGNCEDDIWMEVQRGGHKRRQLSRHLPAWYLALWRDPDLQTTTKCRQSKSKIQIQDAGRRSKRGLAEGPPIQIFHFWSPCTLRNGTKCTRPPVFSIFDRQSKSKMQIQDAALAPKHEVAPQSVGARSSKGRQSKSKMQIQDAGEGSKREPFHRTRIQIQNADPRCRAGLQARA